MDTLVDKSLTKVRSAVICIGKKPLANRAGVPDGCLRRINDPDFSPTVRTLRKLEMAAEAVLAERAAKDASKPNSLSAPGSGISSGAEAAGVPLSLPASAAHLSAHEGVSSEVTAAGAADPASAGSLHEVAA